MKFRGYFLALAGMLLVPAGSPGGELPQTNLAGKSEAAIETLEREVGGASWWVRIGDTLYSPAFAGTREIDGEIGHYGLLCGARLPEEWIPFRAGGGHGYHIVYLPDGKVPVVETAESEDAACRAHAHGLPVPIRPGLSLNVRVRAQKSTGRSGSLSFATVEGLVNQVDKDRYYSTIDALAGFGSRSIYAAGVASARDYIKAEFEALGLTVTTPSFSVQGTPAYNVVGKLEGSAYPGEFLVVGAHYDSRPYSGPAPGAEDNASGTASVIEMARILAPFGS
ncbi:M28 family peptidase, partial [Candidatus Poribacteria bacterium]|nr:M28 family peptidase [Candidatus Poribacteria bacterium]